MVAAGDHEEAPVGQVVDAHGEGVDTSDDPDPKIGVEGEDFVGAPVRDPHSAVAPAWRLGERQPRCHGADLDLERIVHWVSLTTRLVKGTGPPNLYFRG